MLLKLTGGRIIDPAHDVNDVVRDIYIRDGRIVEKPTDGRVDDDRLSLRRDGVYRRL